MLLCDVFFFFKAEDGIRVWTVTGVQTCALPILGDHESAASDSHYDGLLSPPSYTRPPSYRGMDVPAVFLSGDHEQIARGRQGEAERGTRERRAALGAKRGDQAGGERGTVMNRIRAIEREGLQHHISAFHPGDTV